MLPLVSVNFSCVSILQEVVLAAPLLSVESSCFEGWTAVIYFCESFVLPPQELAVHGTELAEKQMKNNSTFIEIRLWAY